jgi:hypothetical protein
VNEYGKVNKSVVTYTIVEQNNFQVFVEQLKENNSIFFSDLLSIIKNERVEMLKHLISNNTGVYLGLDDTPIPFFVAVKCFLDNENLKLRIENHKLRDFLINQERIYKLNSLK